MPELQKRRSHINLWLVRGIKLAVLIRAKNTKKMQAEFGHIILIRDLKDSPTGDTIRSTTKIDYFHSELCFNLLYSNHDLWLVTHSLCLKNHISSTKTTR